MDDTDHRLLIFVVAYEAATHIESMLSRIEAVMPGLQPYHPQVLVIDDASTDNTAELADAFKTRSGFPLTVLRNPVNQGYGGNQKIGYQYALRFGFDSVVLLHGDGQYPPELIGQMVEKLYAADADVVLGSRMLEKENALKGGMPTYKFIGNIILTFLQNLMLGTKLSEFHTGFRLYRTAWLARIPFAYNSNDFDFDTDILIQAKLSQAHIAEIPIPTRYGDEICHVNGVKYAGQILRNSLFASIQKYQIYYHPKYDLEPARPYDSKVGFDSSHDFAIRHTASYSTVLDISHSEGHVAKALRQQKGCYVYGTQESAKDAFDAYLPFTFEKNEIDSIFPSERPVKFVLLLDTLENLASPERFLAALRTRSAAQGSRLIITTANVGFILTRLSLLIGNFNYSKRGILDFRNKRLFTFGSVRRLLVQYGYEIERIEGIPIPFQLMLTNKTFMELLILLNRFAIWISKGLFSYQIAIVAKPLPTLDLLLEQASH